MNKQAFLDALYHHLKALPKAERQQHIDYYAEMIDDRMEEGFDEEAAVGALGNTADIAAQIIGEAPLKTSKKYSVWVILLVVLGSPLWISLLLAAASVVLAIMISIAALYIALWCIPISLYATDLSLLLAFFAGIAGGVFYLVQSIPMPGIALLGAGLVCAGFSVLLFFFCNLLSRLLLKLGKWLLKTAVRLIRRKGKKQ